MNMYIIPLSAVISFLLGMLWYSPFVFANRWQKAVGFKGDSEKGSMTKAFLGSFILMNVMAFGMSWLVEDAGVPSDYLAGFLFGLKIGGFFVGTSTAVNYLYQQKSFMLWFIDAVYQILCLGIMGSLLAGF